MSAKRIRALPAFLAHLPDLPDFGSPAATDAARAVSTQTSPVKKTRASPIALPDLPDLSATPAADKINAATDKSTADAAQPTSAARRERAERLAEQPAATVNPPLIAPSAPDPPAATPATADTTAPSIPSTPAIPSTAAPNSSEHATPREQKSHPPAALSAAPPARTDPANEALQRLDGTLPSAAAVAAAPAGVAESAPHGSAASEIQDGHAATLRTLYLDHFGFAESPFGITPNTDFFYTGARRGAMLDGLIYAITHDEGIIRLTGEVGSGKTMLCRVLMERLPDNVSIVYLANPSLSRDDILHAILADLGVSIASDARQVVVLKALQDHLLALHSANRRVVVLIDEAHAMPRETLEEIRLLSNLESRRHKLLQIVLFAQPELNVILARPDMRQLKERITQNFTLEPLRRQDIQEYLDFRLRAAGYRGASPFSPEAIRLIARASKGLTRRINILADKALLAAFATGRHEVGRHEALVAVRDSQFARIRAALFSWRSLALILAVLLVASGANYIQQGLRAPRGAASTAAIQPKLVDGQSWLAQADGNHWSVQLVSIEPGPTNQPAEVVAALAQATQVLDNGRIKVFHDHAGRLIIAFGEFASAEKANLAAQILRQRLPSQPRQINEWR